MKYSTEFPSAAGIFTHLVRSSSKKTQPKSSWRYGSYSAHHHG